VRNREHKEMKKKRKENGRVDTSERRFVLKRRRKREVLILKMPRQCPLMEIRFREGKSLGSEEFCLWFCMGVKLGL
jgi:hypothetical protein